MASPVEKEGTLRRSSTIEMAVAPDDPPWRYNFYIGDVEVKENVILPLSTLNVITLKAKSPTKMPDDIRRAPPRALINAQRYLGTDTYPPPSTINKNMAVS